MFKTMLTDHATPTLDESPNNSHTTKFERGSADSPDLADDVALPAAAVSNKVMFTTMDMNIVAKLFHRGLEAELRAAAEVMFAFVPLPIGSGRRPLPSNLDLALHKASKDDFAEQIPQPLKIGPIAFDLVACGFSPGTPIVRLPD